jgi:hypothetical protein
MALGVGALMFVAKNRRQIADRTTAQRWLSQSLSDVARDANANLTQQLADLRHALQVAIMEVSRRRRQELAERIHEMKQAEMLGQQERAERKKALLADQQGLGQRTRALGELLTTTSAAIDAILDSPTPAPQTKGP